MSKTIVFLSIVVIVPPHAGSGDRTDSLKPGVLHSALLARGDVILFLLSLSPHL